LDVVGSDPDVWLLPMERRRGIDEGDWLMLPCGPSRDEMEDARKADSCDRGMDDAARGEAQINQSGKPTRWNVCVWRGGIKRGGEGKAGSGGRRRRLMGCKSVTEEREV
jgi:hypothetical protein